MQLIRLTSQASQWTTTDVSPIPLKSAIWPDPRRTRRQHGSESFKSQRVWGLNLAWAGPHPTFMISPISVGFCTPTSMVLSQVHTLASVMKLQRPQTMVKSLRIRAPKLELPPTLEVQASTALRCSRSMAGARLPLVPTRWSRDQWLRSSPRPLRKQWVLNGSLAEESRPTATMISRLRGKLSTQRESRLWRNLTSSKKRSARRNRIDTRRPTWNSTFHLTRRWAHESDSVIRWLRLRSSLTGWKVNIRTSASPNRLSPTSRRCCALKLRRSQHHRTMSML